VVDLSDLSDLIAPWDRQIELRDLMAIFREAGAPRYPCPDESILRDAIFIRTFAWLPYAVYTAEVATLDIANRKLVKDLRRVQRALRPVIDAREDVFGGQSATDPMRDLLPLVELRDLIPAAIGTLHYKRNPTRFAPWHGAANMVADQAIWAWRRAGKKGSFGIKPTSPLVNFTYEFLVRSSNDYQLLPDGKDYQHETIARAFERGIVARKRKATTTP
jgi:hypothetical protein